MDQLEQRVNDFFANAKKNKPEWREEQMEGIKKVAKRCQLDINGTSVQNNMNKLQPIAAFIPDRQTSSMDVNVWKWTWRPE